MGNELLKKIAGALLICQEVKLQVLMDSQKDKPLEPLLAMYENLAQQFPQVSLRTAPVTLNFKPNKSPINCTS